MTEPMTNTASALVRSLSTQYAEPAWLYKTREEAYRAFETMPAPKLEKTDLTKRAWNISSNPTVVEASEHPQVAKLLEDLGDLPYLYLQGGLVQAVHVPQHLVEQGVIYLSMHQALAEHEDLVKGHLYSVVSPVENKWSALNAALWLDGGFLYVPKNVTVDETFHFIYAESDKAAGALPRTLVIGDEGSAFNYVELFFSPEKGGTAGSVHSSVTEVVAKDGAHITVAACTEFRKGPTNFCVRRATLGQDASVDWVYNDVGDGFTVTTIESVLKGNGSHSALQGVGVGFGRQHLELTASMIHEGRFSESTIDLNGVLRDKAATTYRSSTHIVRGADEAASEQSDRMLLLSGQARADAIPMLLIDENDVRRCGHAAKVGRIDPNQVYYLMSRGIAEYIAVRMIVWGFLNPAVEAIPSESVRELVRERINKELTA